MKRKCLCIGYLFLAFLLSLTLFSCKDKNQSIGHVDKSPSVEHLDVAGKRVVYREVLKPPKPAYDFLLTAHTGELLRLKSLHGKVAAVSFIYSGCPDACPVFASYYVLIQRKLPEAIKKRNLQLLLVTTDPEKDTPERLRKYTKAMGGKWLFLTGAPEPLQKVWDAYGVFRQEKERNKQVVIYHSYKTHLIDKNGKTRFIHVGMWNPDDVVKDLQKLLAE